MRKSFSAYTQPDAMECGPACLRMVSEHYGKRHMLEYHVLLAKENELVVSYDSKIYKCTGRDFTCSLQEGELSIDGTIIWDEEKLDKRLSIKTYDNPMCRKCKLLPMCWGPCCQKQIENNNNNLDKYCQLNHMEMSLDDYILFRFNNRNSRNF